jgi:carbamoyltransferase
MTAILGLSAFYHDSAAALVVDGRIVAAAQEERFSRKRHDPDFPTQAVAYCLREAGLTAADLDWVGFYDKPLLKFERLLETYLAYAPAGFGSFAKAMPLWLRTKLHLPRLLRRELPGYVRRFVFAEHHESHAASAFFPSPFDEAAILTVDGVGEWATASFGVGRGNRIGLTHQLRFPHSLGLLYSAFTYYTGFRVNSGEYKVMGLAPYGEPRFVKLILDHLIDLKPDGSFRLDQSYFRYAAGLTMTGPKFHRLFGGPPRAPESKLTQRDMDLAASVQAVTEEVILRMVRHVHRETGGTMKNLCLAGGVALNCVANGRLLREGPFESIWAQPAAGDAGGALGVALLVHHQLLGMPREVDPLDAMRGALLGPSYRDAAIERVLKTEGVAFTHLGTEREVCDAVADHLAAGRVVGWFQGRMEFGPRALGARSILGDPRDPEMQSRMNLKIKFRESFRPFAPAVLRDSVSDLFDLDADSPYMLIVAPVREDQRIEPPPGSGDLWGIDRLNLPRSTVPAVTHVDFSARVQTVDDARNPIFAHLLRAFEARTGCPALVNTSFNVRGEPIVATPADALRCFRATGIDVLSIGPYLVTKEGLPPLDPDAAAAHLSRFSLD